MKYMWKFVRKTTQILGRKWNMPFIYLSFILSPENKVFWPFVDVTFGWNCQNKLAHVEKPISLSLFLLFLSSLINHSPLSQPELVHDFRWSWSRLRRRTTTWKEKKRRKMNKEFRRSWFLEKKIKERGKRESIVFSKLVDWSRRIR